MLNLRPKADRSLRSLLEDAAAIVEASVDRPPEQPANAASGIATGEDLAQYLRATFGIVLPRVTVCPGHCSPWEAFRDAYFAKAPVAVWKASRGFGGKSFTLSLLGLVEALTLGADVNVLGGSGEQSKRVLEAMTKLWAKPGAPHHQLASDPGKQQTTFVGGNVIKALMASQASVRGPHPQRLRLDEIDEMKLAILDSAMGQPMSTTEVLSQTVMSSTHQYPDGTMTAVLRRAKEKGWPVYEWCWKETCAPHGWLSLDEIARKRMQVTDAMWNTEYDLQEPSAEGRAIMTEAVERTFDPQLGDLPGELGHYYEFEPPVTGALYATGADWGRDVDYTEIGTLRCDVRPMRLVAYERLQQVPWPKMIQRFDLRLARFPGTAAHDATGLGKVIHESIQGSAEGFMFVGRPRKDLLTEYIKAIEDDEIRCPRIATIYGQHKYAKNDDVYGSGHLPDTIAMMALAYRSAAGSSSGRGFLAYAREQVEASKRAERQPTEPAVEPNPWLEALNKPKE